jgi:hypothetical protein
VLHLQVWLGSWRGKRVAVKVMHLQNNTLLGSSDQSARHSQDEADRQQQEQQQEQLQRLQRQREQNSPPHMAVMEAVVSSTMSHPNVSCIAQFDSALLYFWLREGACCCS